MAKTVKVVVTKLGKQNAKELDKTDQELLNTRYAMFHGFMQVLCTGHVAGGPHEAAWGLSALHDHMKHFLAAGCQPAPCQTRPSSGVPPS